MEVPQKGICEYFFGIAKGAFDGADGYVWGGWLVDELC